MEVEVECWENQRFVAFKGWGPFRLPIDRPSWSNKKGNVGLHKEAFLVPVGWEWKTPWSIVPNGDNEEGWFYGPDYTVSTRFCSAKPSALSLVRRRKWVRTRGPMDKSADVSWLFSTWCSMISYGFTGSTVEGQRVEQYRQHAGFAALHDLLHADKIDTAPIPPAALASVMKYGVPNMLRRQLWLQWSGAHVRRSEMIGYFSSLSDAAVLKLKNPNTPQDCQEILQDVVRTAPKHPYFDGTSSPGSLRLVNTLVALSLHEGMPAYHQAFSFIVAALLLNMNPEDAFWLMLAIVEQLLPPGYHDQCTLQHDLQIINDLLKETAPQLAEAFAAHQVEISVFCSGWVQGLFCAHFPFPAACRLLDVMFAEGNSSILVRVPLAFLKLNQEHLMHVEGSGGIGEFANLWAREAHDVEELVKAVAVDGMAGRVHRRRARLIPNYVLPDCSSNGMFSPTSD